MKERFIENNIKYILGEDGIYYPNLQLPEDIIQFSPQNILKRTPSRFVYGLASVWYFGKASR